MNKSLKGALNFLSNLSFVEILLTGLVFLSEKTIGRRRKGVFELKELMRKLSSVGYRMNKSGRYSVINVSDLGIKVLLRRFTSDIPVFQQVFLQKQYKPLTDRIFKSGTENSIRNIVDAGANVGYTSLFFKKLFPEARIVGIEPEEGNYNMIERNIALNSVLGITPVKKALWGGHEKLMLDKKFRDGREWAFRTIPGNNGGIDSLTLKDVMEQYGIKTIDILKIDVEGAEESIFQNADFLANVRYLAIEIHKEFRMHEKITNLLAKYNFSYFESGELTIATKQ